MFIVRLVQIIIITIPSVLFGWLLVQEIVPSGNFVIKHSLNKQSPFIDQILPDQRVLDLKKDHDREWVVPIIDDPTFFFVHPHRSFDSVDVEVWFKNNSVPIVELGGLAQIEGQVYDLKPLQNLIIDESNWTRLQDNGTILLQRKSVYSSIAKFLSSLPVRDQIATYHFSLTQPYVLKNYLPSSMARTINISLRGFHQLKTYIKNETLSFDFMYMDMNRTEGQDPITVLVYAQDGTIVADVRATDDGNITSDARESSRKHIFVSVANLNEGVYKIELRATSDIFFRSFTTPQKKVVFLDNIFLADEVAYKEKPSQVRLWTEAKHLGFQTRHAEGVQEITLGQNSVIIDEPYKRFVEDINKDGVVEVIVPRGDVEVFSTGHIAFSKEQYFNPDPVRLVYNTDLDALGINYIIAKYTPAKTVNNWNVAQVHFDTESLFFDQGAWKFVFSTPGIRQLQKQLDIGKINMVLHREPFHLNDILEKYELISQNK